jgi:hypothetical protein
MQVNSKIIRFLNQELNITDTKQNSSYAVVCDVMQPPDELILPHKRTTRETKK